MTRFEVFDGRVMAAQRSRTASISEHLRCTRRDHDEWL
jgi:hypothetical protein